MNHEILEKAHGELCKMCKIELECPECRKLGVPAYCSVECARGRGGVCEHKNIINKK